LKNLTKEEESIFQNAANTFSIAIFLFVSSPSSVSSRILRIFLLFVFFELNNKHVNLSDKIQDENGQILYHLNQQNVETISSQEFASPTRKKRGASLQPNDRTNATETEDMQLILLR